jgi:hypothetical protein
MHEHPDLLNLRLIFHNWSWKSKISFATDRVSIMCNLAFSWPVSPSHPYNIMRINSMRDVLFHSGDVMLHSSVGGCQCFVRTYCHYLQGKRWWQHDPLKHWYQSTRLHEDCNFDENMRVFWIFFGRHMWSQTPKRGVYWSWPCRQM